MATFNAFNNGPAQASSSAVVTTGAMSFDARAHGTPGPTPTALFGFTPFSDENTTSKQIATLQAKLNKKLGPEFISQRPGPSGGPKLTYAEGWKIINLANEVFGFNGWSSSVVSLTTDFIDYSEESRKYNVGVTAIVRVTLRDGAYHEDVGYGMMENGKSKAAALDKCKKEAITDALKRTLRNFGNLLGNCLYDKSYAQEVVKIRVPPVKLDKKDLHRRPEFEERVPDAPAPAHVQAAIPEAAMTKHEEHRVKVEHETHQPETPITYIPRHLRQQMATAANAQTPTRVTPQRASALTSGSSTVETPANRGPSPINAAKPNALATPIQTPARVQRPPPPRAPPARPVVSSPLARVPSAPERNVSFSKPMPMPPRASSVDTADQSMHDVGQASVNVSTLEDDDDDFPLNTQDALMATMDLGDLERPIDYDEGVGGVSISELDAGLELDSADLSTVVVPLPEPQVRDRAASGSSVGSSSSGPSKVQPRDGTPSTASASTSNTVARPCHPNFHPAGVKPPAQHTPKPAAPACLRTNSPQPIGLTNALKRSADVMQAGSSTRPPIQGMGLAQRQQQHQYQQQPRRPPENNASTSTNASEVHDPKRVRR